MLSIKLETLQMADIIDYIIYLLINEDRPSVRNLLRNFLRMAYLRILRIIRY